VSLLFEAQRVLLTTEVEDVARALLLVSATRFLCTASAKTCAEHVGRPGNLLVPSAEGRLDNMHLVRLMALRLS
jgi:hypothetical protein